LGGIALAAQAWDISQDPAGPASRAIDNLNAFTASRETLDARNFADGIFRDFGVADSYLGYYGGFGAAQYLQNNPPSQKIPNPFK